MHVPIAHVQRTYSCSPIARLQPYKDGRCITSRFLVYIGLWVAGDFICAVQCRPLVWWLASLRQPSVPALFQHGDTRLSASLDMLDNWRPILLLKLCVARGLLSDGTLRLPAPLQAS